MIGTSSSGRGGQADTSTAFRSAKDVHISRETSHTYFRITRSTMITHNESGKV